MWPISGDFDKPLRVLDAQGAPGFLRFSPKGRWLAAGSTRDDGRIVVCLWDLTAPREAKPLIVANDRLFLNHIAFDPFEEWLVTAEVNRIAFWPLDRTYARVLVGHRSIVQTLAFTPDGASLLSASGDGTLREWPLHRGGGEESRVLLRERMAFPGLAVDSAGKQAVVSGGGGRVFVVPLTGGPAREMEGFSERTQIQALAFSPDGRRAAAGPFTGGAEEKVIRIWDLEGGGVHVLGPVPGAGEGFEGGVNALAYLGQDRLLATSTKGLLSVDLRDGRVLVLSAGRYSSLAVSRTGSFAFGTYDKLEGGLARFDFDGSEPRTLAAYGPASVVALDAAGTAVASGGIDGIVRVGPVSGGEPHLLFGHKGLVARSRSLPTVAGSRPRERTRPSASGPCPT